MFQGHHADAVGFRFDQRGGAAGQIHGAPVAFRQIQFRIAGAAGEAGVHLAGVVEVMHLAQLAQGVAVLVEIEGEGGHVLKNVRAAVFIDRDHVFIAVGKAGVGDTVLLDQTAVPALGHAVRVRVDRQDQVFAVVDGVVGRDRGALEGELASRAGQRHQRQTPCSPARARWCRKPSAALPSRIADPRPRGARSRWR